MRLVPPAAHTAPLPICHRKRRDGLAVLQLLPMPLSKVSIWGAVPLLKCKQSLARLGSRVPHGALFTSDPASVAAADRGAAVASAATVAAVVAPVRLPGCAVGPGEAAERGDWNNAAPCVIWRCVWQMLLLLLLLLLGLHCTLFAGLGESREPIASSKFPSPARASAAVPVTEPALLLHTPTAATPAAGDVASTVGNGGAVPAGGADGSQLPGSLHEP